MQEGFHEGGCGGEGEGRRRGSSRVGYNEVGEEGAEGQFYGDKNPRVRSRLGGEVVSLLDGLEVCAYRAPQARVGGQGERVCS